MSDNHKIELDFVGIQGKERLTCYTCGRTLVRQPYMTSTEWTKLSLAFLEEHPGDLEVVI